MPGSVDERNVSASASTGSQARYGSDKKLAAYLDIGVMTLYRWQNDPALGFPAATKIHGVKRTNLDDVDAWMRNRRQ